MYVRNSSALMVPPALDPTPGSCAPSSFLAPPAGAVMRAQSRGGMGQVANCPSLEQLMGITDCGDPCQATTGNCAAISFPFAGSGSPTPGSQPIGLTPTIAPVATPSLNLAPWIIGGAALFLGLALLKGLMK